MISDTQVRTAHLQAVSSETALAFLKENLNMLAEVGFLGAARGDVARAERIFKPLALVRPGRAFPLIGLAVAYMNAGRAIDAVRILEGAPSLSDPAERQVLDVWRGFALQQAGNLHASRRLLERVVRQADQGGETDPQALAMARALLGAKRSASG
ncbi:MAG: hypothetical protein WC284_01040 [Candidimonas sp.]|jgi:predicted Zn-dependent protease